MSDIKNDQASSTDSDELNKSGTDSSAGGSEDILGPDGEQLRNRTSKDKVIGNRIDTDNEGRVTQRSNTDI